MLKDCIKYKIKMLDKALQIFESLTRHAGIQKFMIIIIKNLLITNYDRNTLFYLGVFYYNTLKFIL